MAAPWARQIVSSTIDADLLDYLRRDSYFAGLAQNDDDRIFRSFVIDQEHLAINMVKHGVTVPEDTRRTLVDRFHESARNRIEAERSLAAQLACDAAQVIVYCPALSVMKEAAALVRTPAGLLPLNAPEWQPNSKIQTLQARYAGLWRLYVFVPEEQAARTAELARDIFGYPSEFRAG